VYFEHDSAIWLDFPALVPGALFAEGITPDAEIDEIDKRVARFTRRAAERLDGSTESEFPEIQAWRRAFAAMGLKPTQYRCAPESLLGRLRREGGVGGVEPLVEICSGISLACAGPVAVVDVAKVSGHLRVQHASGEEEYLTFAGETEHPAASEVIFADGAGQAHARRWTNRQSALSAVRATTSSALIVAEALHPAAVTDVPNLLDAVAGEIGALWSVRQPPALLSPDSPRFSFSAELTSHGT